MAGEIVPSLIKLQGGGQALWYPTTDLACAVCRAAIVPTRAALDTVRFAFELVNPDPLKQGKYFYLHEDPCHDYDLIVDMLWGWFPMNWVLGLSSAGPYRSTKKELQKLLPTGVYQRLDDQWLPALPCQTPEIQRKGRKTTPRACTPQAAPKATSPLKVRRPGQPGEVYVIEAVGTGLVKIGRGLSATRRVRALSTGTPYPLRLLRTVPVADSQAQERALHARYGEFRRRGEWFALPADLLGELLDEQFA